MSQKAVGKVVIYEDSQAVRIPTIDREPQLVGNLVTRMYQGEKVMTHSFVDNQDRHYSIKPTKEAFRIVDHFDALNPFFQMGYKINRIVPSKGGSNLITYLEPEDPQQFDDPIHWDRAIWDVSNGTGLKEMLIARTSIAPGGSLSYERGLLRLVCTNGLMTGFITQALKVRHMNFDAQEIIDDMLGIPGYNEASKLLGPEIGTPIGVDRFINFMRRIDRDNRGEESVPYFARDFVGSLIRQPGWWHDDFLVNMELLRDNIDRPVHLLDIVNAVTSPVSMEMNRPEERQHSVARSIGRTRSLTDNASRLIGVFSL